MMTSYKDIVGCLQCSKNNLFDCSWDGCECSFAASHGHLNCLKSLHENGFSWDERTCACAAEKGHLDCLIYLHEKGCPWDEWTCFSASTNRHLDCLKYLHENDCPINITTIIHNQFIFFEEEDIEILDYLAYIIKKNNIPIDFHDFTELEVKYLSLSLQKIVLR